MYHRLNIQKFYVLPTERVCFLSTYAIRHCVIFSVQPVCPEFPLSASLSEPPIHLELGGGGCVGAIRSEREANDFSPAGAKTLKKTETIP
jgi:hypothetical protein